MVFVSIVAEILRYHIGVHLEKEMQVVAKVVREPVPGEGRADEGGATARVNTRVERCNNPSLHQSDMNTLNPNEELAALTSRLLRPLKNLQPVCVPTPIRYEHVKPE